MAWNAVEQSKLGSVQVDRRSLWHRVEAGDAAHSFHCCVSHVACLLI